MPTAFVVAFLLAISPPQGSAVPPQLPSTPADCLKAARDFASKRMQELRATGGLAPGYAQKLQEERTATARACAARFDPAKVADTDLAALVELYTEAGQPDLAKTALDRAMASTTLAPADRANVLAQAVLVGLREPKGDERNARLERLVDELDRLPASVFDQQFTAHARMNGYYRGDDIDAGMVKHSTWLIEQGLQLKGADRTKYGSAVVSAYVNLAEVRAGQNQNAEAITLLRRALREWSDLPNVARMVEPTLDRYLLVGTTGAPITAPRWLNAPAGTTTLGLEGKVTLLEFTAHWCGPCRESYPGVNRLRTRFAGRPFQVVLATRLYGYFQTERSLTPEAEVERDKAYFVAEHGLDVPIAIGDQVDVKVEDGKVVYLPTPDPNDVAYKVGGIPQIQLIDRQGRIRLIMVGYDEANEERLAGIIDGLLAEK